MIKKIALTLIVTMCATAAMAQAIQKGERSFNKCLACHAIGPNAETRIGPPLNGLDGRKAGTTSNFHYSDAIKNSEIVWTEETFRDFIRNPAGKVPGNKMTFSGIKSDLENSELWTYIRQFNAEGSVK